MFIFQLIQKPTHLLRSISTRHVQVGDKAVPIPCRLDKFIHDGSKLSHEDIITAWLSGRVVYRPAAHSNKPFAADHYGNSGRYMSDIYVFEDDEVLLDVGTLSFREPTDAVRVFALHKPAGIAMEKAFNSQEVRRRQHEQIRVAELQKMGRRDVSIARSSKPYRFLERIPAGFFPVGRLDKDTTGLLLLTNCGDMANLLTTPGLFVKEYECEITRKFLDIRDQPRLDQLLKGVVLREPKQPHSSKQPHSPREQQQQQDGGERGPAVAEYVRPSGHVLAEAGTETGNAWRLALGIAEGRNRVVRKMLGAVGLPLGALHRTKVGSADLNALGLLRAGAVTELSREGVEQLWQSQLGGGGGDAPERDIVRRKLRALKRHVEHLREPKVNQPNSRLEAWIAEYCADYPHLQRVVE